MDLDSAISEVRVYKARLDMLGKDAPREAFKAARKAVRAKKRIVLEILYIRQYFCNGYTIHPNQIVSPKMLTREGLCNRSVLQFICACLRNLIAIRDSDNSIGLHMSPLDFLRWRLSVYCRFHKHEAQANLTCKSNITMRGCIQAL